MMKRIGALAQPRGALSGPLNAHRLFKHKPENPLAPRLVLPNPTMACPLTYAAWELTATAPGRASTDRSELGMNIEWRYRVVTAQPRDKYNELALCRLHLDGA